MTNCTWKDCDQAGILVQWDKNYEQWAYLCLEHDRELNKTLDNPSPKTLLKYWVLANGGAKKMTEKIFGEKDV